ncbi:MAG: hypothetical protein CMJ75_13985 [Planctomycetaceae bacterium]|nr:hypothetical protein [Planctomycetaceae bacterium]
MTTLFHGTYAETAPTIKIGKNALGAQDNVFDGLFANSTYSVCESHGSSVFAYEVDSIATNDDLDCDEAVVIIASELMIDADVAAEIASAVAFEESLEDYADNLNPRSEFDCDDLGWEMQRLRGVIARKLGFDAVECEDEHGTSYLIVNKDIKGGECE